MEQASDNISLDQYELDWSHSKSTITLVTTHPVQSTYNFDQPDAKHPGIIRIRSIRQWKWEILALTFSSLCLAIVIVLLLVMNNRRLADWTLPISPNALVSIAITLSKSSLLMLIAEGISQLKWAHFAEKRQVLYDLQLFDAASRGPWGAFLLLYARKFKPILACIGAVITIIALAMDPCAQQILEFRTLMMQSSSDTAEIRAAAAYDVAVHDGGGVSAFAGERPLPDSTTPLIASRHRFGTEYHKCCLHRNVPWLFQVSGRILLFNCKLHMGPLSKSWNLQQVYE